MIGQIAVMKMTKIAEGWPSRKAASDSGSQASGGMVRSTWKSGSRPRIAQVDLADQHAERDADDGGQRDSRARRAGGWRGHARRGPCRGRRGRRTGARSAPSCSSRIDDGDGSGESGLAQSTCQTQQKRSATTSGGSTRRRPPRPARRTRRQSGAGRGGRKATIVAGRRLRVGTAVAGDRSSARAWSFDGCSASADAGQATRLMSRLAR